MTSTFRCRVFALLTMLVLHPSLAATAEETAPNQLTAEQIAEGWISLFDGETLFGWTPTSKANWKEEEGPSPEGMLSRLSEVKRSCREAQSQEEMLTQRRRDAEKNRG